MTMPRSTIGVALLLLLVLGCKSDHPRPTSVPPTPVQPEELEERTSMITFDCTWAEETHPLEQIGHNLPDAAFALSLTDEQRAEYRQLDNEDTLVIGDAHFVRAWAPFTVLGTEHRWGLGLWIKISPGDFAEFESRFPEPHPPYRGTIANQNLYGAPILGLAAEIRFRPPEVDVEIEIESSKAIDGRFVRHPLRPEIRFLDEAHPLTRFQRDGLPLDVLRGWLSEMSHKREKQPKREPLDPVLASDGWSIASPTAFGKPIAKLSAPPKAGDGVKAYFEVLAADERGEPMIVRAGWWIMLDDVSRAELWSGTLDSYTRFPATLRYRSRVWVRPDQIVQHKPASSAPQ